MRLPRMIFALACALPALARADESARFFKELAALKAIFPRTGYGFKKVLTSNPNPYVLGYPRIHLTHLMGDEDDGFQCSEIARTAYEHLKARGFDVAYKKGRDQEGIWDAHFFVVAKVGGYDRIVDFSPPYDAYMTPERIGHLRHTKIQDARPFEGGTLTQLLDDDFNDPYAFAGNRLVTGGVSAGKGLLSRGVVGVIIEETLFSSEGKPIEFQSYFFSASLNDWSTRHPNAQTAADKVMADQFRAAIQGGHVAIVKHRRNAKGALVYEPTTDVATISAATLEAAGRVASHTLRFLTSK